jgi:hypothetical protein
VTSAFVYGDDAPQVISRTAMTLDEARRIAANIARIPDYRKRSVARRHKQTDMLSILLPQPYNIAM